MLPFLVSLYPFLYQIGTVAFCGKVIETIRGIKDNLSPYAEDSIILLKHFTAHNIISRWSIVGVYSRANASAAAHSLDTLEKRMPFPVRATQVDGAAEFEAVSEEAYQKRGIKLFVLPSRSPKLNGAYERVHNIDTRPLAEYNQVVQTLLT